MYPRSTPKPKEDILYHQITTPQFPSLQFITYHVD